MKTKTSELTDAALDWAVAKCEGLTVYKDAMLGGLVKHGWWVSGMSIDPNTWHPLAMFEPSTDWSQGGPIIELEGLTAEYLHDSRWIARHPTAKRHSRPIFGEGPTPLVAAMRCYVASKLGDEVEVPDELV